MDALIPGGLLSGLLTLVDVVDRHDGVCVSHKHLSSDIPAGGGGVTHSGPSSSSTVHSLHAKHSMLQLNTS